MSTHNICFHGLCGYPLLPGAMNVTKSKNRWMCANSLDPDRKEGSVCFVISP